MLSRLVIWVLLLLVPFQSFAAVGLAGCPVSTVAAARFAEHPGHLRPASAPARPATRGHEVGAAGTTTTSQHHFSQTNDAHHVHKLPCCSDAAIIIGLAPRGIRGSEAFVTALAVATADLTSVFLEGPKRPPRLALN